MANVLRFLHNPFDPLNNVQMFNRFVEPWLPVWLTSGEAPCLDAVLEAIALWRELHPEYIFPDEAELRDVWDRLGPASKELIYTHDTNHIVRHVRQDAAGEYELATLMLLDPDTVLDQAYGGLVLATLPLGSLRSPDGLLAPIKGVLRGILRVGFGN
ncbi:MAG: hypothetical protein EBY17_23325 [Acidobacteriia bacterium]|nr:hypothetical protein [Terriglobia bacterium]